MNICHNNKKKDFEWMSKNENNKINQTHPIMQAIPLCTEGFGFITAPVFPTLI